MTASEGKKDQSRLAESRGVLRSPVINLVGTFGGLRGGKGNERDRQTEREILERGGLWSTCSLVSGSRSDICRILLSPFPSGGA